MITVSWSDIAAETGNPRAPPSKATSRANNDEAERGGAAGGARLRLRSSQDARLRAGPPAGAGALPAGAGKEEPALHPAGSGEKVLPRRYHPWLAPSRPDLS